jgi:hypothetical protein
LQRSSFTPDVDPSLKPVVGMAFDNIIDVEKFYKDYAHDGGFSVRVGQHKKANEIIKCKFVR